MPASAERKRNLGRVPGRWWLVSLYLVLLILSAQFPFFSAIERFAPGTPVEVHAFDFVGDKVVKTDRKIPIRAHLHGVDGQKEEEAQGQYEHKEVEDCELWREPKYAWMDYNDEDSEDDFYMQCGRDLYDDDHGEQYGCPGDVCAPAALSSFAPTILEDALFWPHFLEGGRH